MDIFHSIILTCVLVELSIAEHLYADFGEACDGETTLCEDGMNCEGKCKCSDEAFYNGFYCQKRKYLLETCSNSLKCEEEFRCVNGACHCPEDEKMVVRLSSKSFCMSSGQGGFHAFSCSMISGVNECEDPLQCVAGTCQCDPDSTTPYWNGHRCSTVGYFGAACSFAYGGRCTAAGFMCDLYSGMCSCDRYSLFTYWDMDTRSCHNKIGYGYACQALLKMGDKSCVTGFCHAIGTGTSDTGRCACRDGYYWDRTECTRRRGSFNETCTVLGYSCVDGLVCMRMAGQFTGFRFSYRCQCPPALYWNGSICVESLEFGDACQSSSVPCGGNMACQLSNVVHVGGNVTNPNVTCGCDGDKKWNGYFCVSDGDFGAFCNSSSECGPDLTCRHGACQCSNSSTYGDFATNICNSTEWLDLMFVTLKSYADRVIITWTPPVNPELILNYTLSVGSHGDVVVERFPYLTIEGLENGTLYPTNITVWIRQVDEVMPLVFTNLTIATQPIAPSDVQISVSRNETINLTVTWTASPSDPDSYYIMTTPTGLKGYSLVLGHVTKTTFTDLVWHEKYSVDVYAEKNSQLSSAAWSQSKYIPPLPPTEVRNVSLWITDNATNAEWLSPAEWNGHPREYQIIVYQRPYTDAPYEIDSIHHNPYTSDELVKMNWDPPGGGPYLKFSIVPMNKQFVGPSTEIFTQWTKVPGNVTSLRVHYFPNNTLKVRWWRPEKPNGMILQYIIQVDVEERKCISFKTQCSSCHNQMSGDSKPLKTCSHQYDLPSYKNEAIELRYTLNETTWNGSPRNVTVYAFTSAGFSATKKTPFQISYDSSNVPLLAIVLPCVLIPVCIGLSFVVAWILWKQRAARTSHQISLKSFKT